MISPMKQREITLYGIPNCDTVKKARAWLAAQSLDYTFHDFKKQGVSMDRLQAWCSALGVNVVLNQKGTTWRALTPTEQESATEMAGALELMHRHTSLIKRPIVEWSIGPESKVTAGFSPEAWAQHATGQLK
jgi:arsenate reductase (glutaredoxin)